MLVYLRVHIIILDLGKAAERNLDNLMVRMHDILN